MEGLTDQDANLGAVQSRAQLSASDLFLQLQNVVQALALVGQRLQRWLNENAGPLEAAIERAGASWNRYQLLEASGWLPHYTTPFDLIDRATDASAAHVILENHYEQNWDDVEASFRERLATYGLCEETLAAFDEALIAHRHGLYRACSRTLFPEIERLARQQLFNGEPKITSKWRDMRHKAEDFGMENFSRTGVFSVRIYEKFSQHMYSKVENSDQIEVVEADPIPNRHAAMHGHVVYNTAQSSLNALIMTEFSVLTILALKNASMRGTV